MYYVVSINDVSIVYGQSVIIDTAAHLCKKLSKKYTCKLLVVSPEGKGEWRVRGFGDEGIFYWADDCNCCNGLVKWSMTCENCDGLGATVGRTFYG